MRVLLCVIVTLMFAMPALAYESMTKQAILQRIKPIGEVNLTAPKPEAANEASQVEAKSTVTEKTKQTAQADISQEQKYNLANGEKIYNQYCAVCHKTGAANAPKLGDKQAWQPRIAQGLAKLDEHAIKGFKMMPPKGTCMNCTDQDIKDTVKYMVEKSQ